MEMTYRSATIQRARFFVVILVIMEMTYRKRRNEEKNSKL